MHALAQPITLLQAQLYLSRSAGALGAPLSLKNGAASVEHLCHVFRLLQELVHVQALPAQITAVPFARILAAFSDDAEAIFAGSGLLLHLDADLAMDLGEGRAHPAQELTMCIDFERVRHAIASILHIARESSRSGTVVGCRWSIERDWVKLCIRPQQAGLEVGAHGLSEESRLHLALATASLKGQPAGFRMEEKPFALLLRLPLADRVDAAC